MLFKGIAGFSLLAAMPYLLHAQKARAQTGEKPKQESSASAEPQIPAQIELLETQVRFEANGDSRKEVHARVKINNELGARQFARLNFDFNRSFQSVEIPMVRVTHPSGGTADILPSAITDQPNPAVVNAPAYQDVRVKSVRILGLAPGDLLEYRVVTTTTHPPLAPAFWLDHTFDRTGVVSHEIFELDVPASRFEPNPPQLPKSYPPSPNDPLGIAPPLNEAIGIVYPPGPQRSWKPGRVYVSSQTPEESKNRVMQDGSPRLIYRWDINNKKLHESGTPQLSGEAAESDITISTFASWSGVASALGGGGSYFGGAADLAKLQMILGPFSANSNPAQSVYEAISRRVRTIDLPFEGYESQRRSWSEIASSGYGTATEKAGLFRILTTPYDLRIHRIFFTSKRAPESLVPRPSIFSRLLIEVGDGSKAVFLDPSMEVAPYGLLAAHFRGGDGLKVDKCQYDESRCWTTIHRDLPFVSTQHVRIDATVALGGTMTANVRYVMRGDNELLLRLAFHQAPKENWKNVAQLLALSDGFRGQVVSVTASDPYATKEPFSVEYEIEQPKFVDWSKTPVRIPAILPLLGLPDLPGSTAAGDAQPSVDLGTPLDVETSVTLHLPPGTTARTPTGTAVNRDYASYSSTYSAQESSVTATRHLHFLLREIPASRALDYNAFLRAVQTDEAQEFTLDRPSVLPSAASPSTAPIHP
jgi:Domain of Unknown Function with PDB structure (DUF3857)